MIHAVIILALAFAAVVSGSDRNDSTAQAADQPREPPYSCRLLYDEQEKCAFGSCDKRVVERLTRECLRDDGRP
jgi:hypothetical protein